MKIAKIDFEPYKDMFNYYNLIRKINPGFRLFFNKRKENFAIVNIYNNFEICKEFDTFSEDIVRNLRFYSISNYSKILKNIEDYNENLEHNQLKTTKEKTNFALKEILNLYNRSNNIQQNDINKIIGATKC